MTDRKEVQYPNEPPEDVVLLYTWANLHGAKYRDFSASHAQRRERGRQRVQQAVNEQKERSRQEGEAQRAEEVRCVAGAARIEERIRSNELVEQPAEITARQTGQRAAPQFAQQAGQQARAAQAQAAVDAQRVHQSAQPAWLAERTKPAAPAPSPQPADATLQGSRDRIAARWFALKGLFDRAAAAPESAPAAAPATSRAPVLAVFSLAGGVGKTSLLATLGRTLSARGERALMVDTSTFGLLPFFYGAREQRPGQLRTFNPPAGKSDAPIQMIAIDPEALGRESAAQNASVPSALLQDPLVCEIGRHALGISRVLIDLPTASGATMRRILKLSPLVLIPLTPDLNSVVSVASIDAFFERNAGASGKLPYYVLNQFDPSLPLHLDVREVLRGQLGERLLPFALRRTPAVSEALAEGMTVIDYAPNSTVAEDFSSLAGWVKSQSAAISGSFRGVRWSER